MFLTKLKHAPTIGQNLALRYFRRSKKLPGIVQMRRRINLARSDCAIVSYPKCGRTWLRAMLGRALQYHYGLAESQIMQTANFYRIDKRIARICSTHDDFAHNKPVSAIETNKTKYASKQVILLVRDPRDVIVSLYFQKKFRRPGRTAYQGTLSEFLEEEVGGMESLLAFYNAWADNRHVPKGLLLVRYEDIIEDPQRELRRVLEFLNIDWLPDEAIAEAVRFGQFDNLRKVEQKGTLKHGSMRNSDPSNSEAFKVRRGKPGGYTDYLDAAQIAALNQTIADQLSDFYSCYK